MFSIFKRKNKQEEEPFVCAPVNGKIIPLEAVKDEVFSKKMLGDGFAVEPEDGEVVAPINGILETVFPTGHAFGIKASDGKEVLVHIGIDTVELNGRGFTSFVKQGDTVKTGDKIIQADLEVIKNAGYSPITMVLITNEQYGIEEILNQNSIVKKNTEILRLRKNNSEE